MKNEKNNTTHLIKINKERKIKSMINTSHLIKINEERKIKSVMKIMNDVA
jgi:hypothetical protein